MNLNEAMESIYTEMLTSWSKEEIINYARNLTIRIREDDQTELKHLAEKYNYKLVPIRKYERYLPCVCGCNRREHWSHVSPGSAPITVLKCKNCGLVAEGKTETEAKHNWNELVKERENSLKQLRKEKK